MKIGLIGNMNNNNFSLMRYMRDLGADAHLLLYANDGRGALSHFCPESDTWEIEKWAPYIHQTDIPNAAIATLDFPVTWLMGLRSWLKHRSGRQELYVPPVSKGQIRAAYKEFDRLIASGATPATLTRVNRYLDIFYPYGNGVEYLFNADFVHQFSGSNGLIAKIFSKIQQRQTKGIRGASITLNFEPGITDAALRNIGVNSVKLAAPIIYSGEKLPAMAPNDVLAEAQKLIDNSSFSVLHHARIMWRNKKGLNRERWQNENKNSHWLIHAFADLVRSRPDAKPLLLMVEYGQDVEDTKELIQQLGISANVKWLPKMARRDLMWLLARVSVGAGEFYEEPKMIWGGTGWEVLASGKPLLQGFNFRSGEFDATFGYPPPPILRVTKQEHILQHLIKLSDCPEFGTEIGRQAGVWFDTFNGRNLAKKWLGLLEAPT